VGMAMIDIESLLAAAPESPPCGPNLEYDPEFLELDQMARGKEERQSGELVIKAEPPPWPEVLDKASALLPRSKDLRVACLFLRACVQVHGFNGLVPGVRLIHLLLERYWDGVYPLLDTEDGGDPTTRMNALAPLVNPLVLLKELRDTALVRSRQHGQVKVRDVEVALNKLPPRAGDAALTQSQIESMLAAAVADEAAPVPAVGAALAAVSALSALLDGKVGPSQAPDLRPLLATLQALAQVVREPAAQGLAEEPSHAAAQERPAAQSVEGPHGELRSRQDALAMIDKVIQYLEANEPTNPAPLLLKRSKRFMTMSFVDIVKEIAPESIEKFNVIAGPDDAA
jgi:type VI secretion system protein ImpA